MIAMMSKVLLRYQDKDLWIGFNESECAIATQTKDCANVFDLDEQLDNILVSILKAQDPNLVEEIVSVD